MTRLVITGANGYIGSRLVMYAASQPAVEVRTVTRSRADWLPGDAYIVNDFGADIGRASDHADVVVHLAGVNEVAFAADPEASFAATVRASQAVAGACEENGVSRLIYVSTVHVYGDALKTAAVIDEGTVANPISQYASARLASEDVVLNTVEACEPVIFRLTNSVGSPASLSVNRSTLVALDLCHQAVTDGLLRLKSDGRQWRDFVALRDVCSILLSSSLGPISPGIYNLGSGSSLTVGQLANMIADEAENCQLERPRIRLGPPGERSNHFSVSVEKLRSEGLTATTPLNTAIRETLEFFLRH